MDDRVTVELSGGVADVRLARPDKMNALDDAMFDALIATGERLKDDAQVRAVVISGEGRAFCAGLDMSLFQTMAVAGDTVRARVQRSVTSDGLNRGQRVAMIWREIPAPVIAAIHGVALGGGLQLALGADLRLVAPDARLGLLEINWGLVPDMGGAGLLPRLVRDDLARELIFTGRMVSGEEAAAIGLATRVCADPRAEALKLAAEIAGRSPEAVRAAKRLMNLAADASLSEALAAERLEQTALIGSPSQREAVAASFEKRAARFVS